MKKILLAIACLLICTKLLASDVQIKIVVAYPTGGPVGSLAQILQKSLSAELQKTVVIDYRPGAGSSIGTVHALTQTSDPVLLLNTSAIILNTFKNPQPYSTNQLRPVAYLGSVPLVLVASKKSNLTNFQQFSNSSRVRPLNYGSSGVGTMGHLVMEQLNLSLKLDVTHVPYRGTNHVVIDLLGGNLDLGFVFVSPAILTHIKKGDLVPLVVDHSSRLTSLPQVPVLKEFGFSDHEDLSWFAVFQGGKWDPVVLSQVQKAIQNILADPVLSQPYKDFGLAWGTNSTIPKSHFVDMQVQSFAKLVKRIQFE